MTIAGQKGAMGTRRIGSLDVSVVGLGCNNFGWKLDEAATAAVVHAALDAGITFFDTADIYGDTRSEVFLGRALGKRRDHVVIATKFGMAVDDLRRGARPEYVKQAAECRRLGIAFLAFFPLASGLLTGKYRQGHAPPEGSRLATVERFAKTATDRTLAIVESLLQFATSRRHTLVELVVSWLASKSAIASVIAGATSPEQVRTNAAAAMWNFTEEELTEIERLLSQSN